ncbi:SMI1/KNR4 family protein [Dactylosporangium sp. CA-233914]|uniref:SMI1/KNR4 family protein n=1 Tax=Dactylosporangium sp. CA-233914 TaxID=3239934 RepID=UPI003D8B47A5
MGGFFSYVGERIFGPNARLVEMVPPPSAGRPAPDWRDVESRLGVVLPADYKRLVEVYGPGRFGDFLEVYTPGAASQWVDIFHQAGRGEWRVQQFVQHGEQLPVEPSSLLPVAGTDNGDTVYWVRKPLDQPDRWTIVVNQARNFLDWPAFDGGLVEFLVAVFSKEHKNRAFPDDFPDPVEPTVFTPSTYSSPDE